MRNSIRLITSLAALACATASANAATAIITYKGKVYGSSDAYEAFGIPAIIGLDGAAYTAKYIVNVPTPGSYFAASPVFSETYGGAAYSTLSPVSATLTINGVSITAGDYKGHADRVNEMNGNYDQIQNETENYRVESNIEYYTHIYNYAFSTNNDLVSSSNLIDDFVSFDPSNPNQFSGGVFSAHVYNFNTGQRTAYVFGSLTVESISISAAGVPEPASWALMLAGFGMMGAALRSAGRRSVVAA